MLRTFGSKTFETSVEETLQRLKRRAEARYQSRGAEQS